jgi:thymidylate kinase
MLNAVRSNETRSSLRVARNNEQERILLSVFRMLENAGVEYCVPHGYDDFSSPMKSDVDCIISANVSDRALEALLRSNSKVIGAELVLRRNAYFVLASRDENGTHSFIALDFSRNYDVCDLPLYSGRELLQTRRSGNVRVPASDIEFGAYLARCVAKRSLNEDRTRRLSDLYQRSPLDCAQQVSRFWSGTSAKLLVAGAESGDWTAVYDNLSNIAAELRRKAIGRRPARFLANKILAIARRVKRLLNPDGLSVAFLGPDGAGKSSVIATLPSSLDFVFPRVSELGFAPGLLSFMRRGSRSTSEPHGLQPRSPLISLARVAYWISYYILSWPALRFALARSTLVLYDRHFVDILVDQRRYRYGGPLWLLRLAWRCIPKPDLIILLDAPAEVLQARKQEVPMEVSARQREAYLALIHTLPNGHIVDSSQSSGDVTNDIVEIILRHTRPGYHALTR